MARDMVTATATIMGIPMSINPNMMHLLQLASPTLPVGAYAYSQGLEHAIERQWVSNADQTADWISGIMNHALVHVDLPVYRRIFRAFGEDDWQSVQYWNDYLLASRESRELQNEDLHLGSALLRLLNDLGVSAADDLVDHSCIYATAFALASRHWQIDVDQSLVALLWSWVDNQVAAAVKLVPLGQTEGQRILMKCQALIPAAIEASKSIQDEDIGFSLSALAVGSAHHEQQYSRLFRS